LKPLNPIFTKQYKNISTYFLLFKISSLFNQLSSYSSLLATNHNKRHTIVLHTLIPYNNNWKSHLVYLFSAFHNTKQCLTIHSLRYYDKDYLTETFPFSPDSAVQEWLNKVTFTSQLSTAKLKKKRKMTWILCHNTWQSKSRPKGLLWVGAAHMPALQAASESQSPGFPFIILTVTYNRCENSCAASTPLRLHFYCVNSFTKQYGLFTSAAPVGKTKCCRRQVI